MPKSEKTRRVLPEEWEDRKTRITELYLDKKLKLRQIIDSMKEEGFVASKAQYEYQFRLWGTRKNITRQEWQRIIQEREQGVQSAPITFGGRVIPTTRSNKAIRRYRHGALQATESGLDESDRPTGENLLPTIPAGDGNGLVESLAFHASSPPAEPAGPTTNADTYMGNDLRLDHSVPLELNDETFNMASLDPFVGFPTSMEITNLFSPVDISLTPGATNMSNWHMSPDWDWGIYESNGLHSQGAGMIHSRRQTPFSRPASPSIRPEDCVSSPQPQTSFPRSPPGVRRSARSPSHQGPWEPPSASITMTLMKEIYRTRAAMAHNNSPPCCSLVHSFLSIVKVGSMDNEIIKFLFSTEDYFGEHFLKPPHHLSLWIVAEARLYSRLITSCINGFVGLQGTSPTGVLRYLSQHPTTDSLMLQIMSTTSSPSMMELAANIFQAALESDNVDIVKFLLLRSAWFHANDTVCVYRGARCTPIEIAAANHSFAVLELLIGTDGVDVNKSLTEGPRALTHLLERIDRKATLDDRLLKIVDAFIDAGAWLGPDSYRIGQKLMSFVDSRLLFRVIEKLTIDQALTLIWETNPSGSSSAAYSEQNVIGVIEIVEKKLQQPKSERALHSFQLWANEAICRAVENGYENLVRALLPHISSAGKALHIARRRRNPSIANLILGVFANDAGRTGHVESSTSTIRSGKQERHLALQQNTILKHSTDTEAARDLAVALLEGKLDVVNKIWDSHPYIAFNSYSSLVGRGAGDLWASVLSAALNHDLDEIAWHLLAFITTLTGEPDITLPLYTAIKKRRQDFIRDMMSQPWPQTRRLERRNKPSQPRSQHDDDLVLILEAALEWGDDAIITEICRNSHFTYTPSRKLFEFMIEKNLMNLFWDILRGSNGVEAQGAAVDAAMSCNNVPLLDDLVNRYVEVYDRVVILENIQDPLILESLLKGFRKVYPRKTHARCGCLAVHQAIRRRPIRSREVDLFFEYGLVHDCLEGCDPDRGLLTLTVAECMYEGKLEDDKRCLIERLVDCGSDVNMITNYNGHPTTPLLVAIEQGSIEIVKFLIKKGADVNKPAKLGLRRTPLQEAAASGSREIVHLLLENGAEINAPPAQFVGATALQFAAASGNCQIAKMLLDHGGIDQLHLPPPKGYYGRWPLEAAAENGRLDMIQFLWDINGGPFDEKICRRAQWFAEHNAHIGCKKLISDLMNGASGPAANDAAAGTSW